MCVCVREGGSSCSSCGGDSSCSGDSSAGNSSNGSVKWRLLVTETTRKCVVVAVVVMAIVVENTSGGRRTVWQKGKVPLPVGLALVVQVALNVEKSQALFRHRVHPVVHIELCHSEGPEILVRCGVVWCGVVWCGVVCGVVWCGVVWCGVVWCGR